MALHIGEPLEDYCNCAGVPIFLMILVCDAPGLELCVVGIPKLIGVHKYLLLYVGKLIADYQGSSGVFHQFLGHPSSIPWTFCAATR
jgi:hypothetical protein